MLPEPLDVLLRRNTLQISLSPTTKGWQANRRNPDRSYSVAIDADPAKALREVLTKCKS